MYSQPQKFTDSEFYCLSKQLILGILDVWQELNRFHGVQGTVWEYHQFSPILNYLHKK